VLRQALQVLAGAKTEIEKQKGADAAASTPFHLRRWLQRRARKELRLREVAGEDGTQVLPGRRAELRVEVELRRNMAGLRF